MNEISKNSHSDDDLEEIELEPQKAASIPFVKTSLAPPSPSPRRSSSPLLTNGTNPAINHLKTPVELCLSAPAGTQNGKPKSSTTRPYSCTDKIASDQLDTNSLSVQDVGYSGSRRPSALDILSCGGSEGAIAAVERAKERRKIIVFMSRASHALLYILPTLIVLCLILYWTIPGGDEHKWLTMLAAILGCACVVDFIIYQYFSNRREGTGLNNTLAKFRARLKRSGRRF